MKRKKKHSLKRRLKRLFLLLILLGALFIALALGALSYAETHLPPAAHQTDAIVVLGAQVRPDGELSLQLQLRLEAALESYQKNPRPIIVCGAQGRNEPLPEGEAMKNWLLEKGLPKEDILSEIHSYNTYENIANARALLPENAKSVTIVTSDYHLPRALAISGDQGLTAEGVPAPTQPEWWIKNHGREVLAWGKYLLKKVIPID